MHLILMTEVEVEVGVEEEGLKVQVQRVVEEELYLGEGEMLMNLIVTEVLMNLIVMEVVMTLILTEVLMNLIPTEVLMNLILLEEEGEAEGVEPS